LFTLAHHRAIDVLRKSGREVSNSSGGDDDSQGEPWRPAPAAEAWQAWPAAASSVEDEAFWRSAGQRLLNCLESLPAAQRSVFLLHHEDGLALEELARSLEVGFETAKSRLRYAMSKLRTCMGAFLPAGQV
jgi:RNA polymerase sigma factor (sigma-70 family)